LQVMRRAIHAVLATTILQLANLLVPAALVQTSAPVELMAAWMPKVAVPELPLAQVMLTVCVAEPAPKLKLGGLMLGVPRLPVPVTVTAALMSWLLMMFAAGHGDVAEEQANTVTGSAHRVAVPSSRNS